MTDHISPTEFHESDGVGVLGDEPRRDSPHEDLIDARVPGPSFWFGRP
jgi:hypothetical protein